jgi:hypothetical protein
MRSVACTAYFFLLFMTTSCAPPAPTTSAEVKASPTKKGRPVSLEELGFVRPTKPGIDMTVHRVGAGELDESGWCLARSTGGGFSVSLPNVFNDFAITAKAEDGVEITTFVVATRNERLVKFTAVAMSRPDGKFKRDPLQGLVDQFEKQGTLKSKRSISMGEMKGVEIRVASHSSSSAVRAYKAPTVIYNLIVESPASINLEEIDGDVNRFLDSLAVPDKPQK